MTQEPLNSNPDKPVVAIIGCGYVGLTTAAILANCGYKVHAIEINKDRLASIKDGRSFFYEEGVDALLASGLEHGSLQATDSFDAVIPESDIVFSCVGTPDNPDGSSNLTYVFDAAAQAAQLMKDSAVYVQKSTVPVGTGVRVKQLFSDAGKNFPYVSNPEFLREGTAISDSLWFDRVVTGSDDAAAAERVLELYRTVERERDAIAAVAGLRAPSTIPEARYTCTGLNSAELIKVTANAFLALKISFANSIAKLADQAGADIVEVMDAVGADRRIGRAFLNAGRGYGGGCFPKDVSGLIRSAEEYGVSMEIMNSAVEVNNSMPHYIIAKAAQRAGKAFKGQPVAVLGLSFKAGTSDTRRSPAIAIANTLAAQGADVTAYDPEAIQEARHDLDQSVKVTESPEEAINGAGTIFIATDWPEFKNYDWAGTRALVVDCMNCLPREAVKQLGDRYLGVGR